MKKAKASEPVIVRVPLDSLKVDPKNPRVHGEKNLKAIADSLSRFGQVEPILIEKKTRKIIGGHGRVAALREQGATDCLVVELDVTGKESRALALALNRTSDLAEYDNALLREALEDLDVPGFDEADLEEFFPAEEPPKPDPGPQGPTSVRILLGDVRARLKDLPDESIQCCVTSPPYWGLRDYGTATWEGGKKDHEHVGSKELIGQKDPDSKQYSNRGAQEVWSGDCACGAKRIDSQIGLEDSPEVFIEQIVAVFREVRRVMKKDGTLWMNLGDSYAGGSGCATDGDGLPPMPEGRARRKMATLDQPARSRVRSLKPKDLCGIPWRVALALQADGWYLRSDIIWAKPNPMPESVTDRPTKSHEYVFLLSKSGEYFWDDAASQEQAIAPKKWKADSNAYYKASVGNSRSNPLRDVSLVGDPLSEGTRNMRSVWTIATEPTSDAHFATYPTELVRRCLAAGSKPGDVVLDPFFGAGTTGLVAARMGRSAIGCELNAKYAEIASRRIHSDAEAKATVTIEK